MKTLRYIAGVMLLSATLIACGDGKKATPGDAQDTTKKIDTTASTASPSDTAKTDSSKATPPTDNTAVDTSDARPVH